MDKFVIKRPRNSINSSSNSCSTPTPTSTMTPTFTTATTSTPAPTPTPIPTDELVSDPGLRKQIIEFDVGSRDRIRREYISKGPCQPKGHDFPKTKFGDSMRPFREEWYKKYDWLEYSISNDAAYCFICYLFKPINVIRFGDEAYTRTGFRNWKRATEKFNEHLAELYPNDFSWTELLMIQTQLNMYIYDVKKEGEFANIEDLGSLAKKMISTRKAQVYPLVYRLIELALLLPVATASVERVFSAMNIVKTDLRNRMGDGWMNDSLVVYIEKEIFEKIDNDVILRHFQNMSSRKIQLPSSNRA